MKWQPTAIAFGVTLAAALSGGSVLARRLVVPRRRRTTRILDVTDRTITLELHSATRQPGVYGLWFGTGLHATIGDVLAVDTDRRQVTRLLLAVTGAGLEDAAFGTWTGHSIANPADVDSQVRTVELPLSLGPAPAWVIGPELAPTWAIHIHGIHTSRVAVLRSVPAFRELGYTSIVPSFRGDGEGPPDGSRSSTLGTREWQDIEKAVEHARFNGAQRIVLVGWSMGAAMALLVAERSKHRSLIHGIVLVAPALYWQEILRNGLARAGVPCARAGAAAVTAVLATPLLCRLAGLHSRIPFRLLDWGRPSRLRKPTLLIHSDGDVEVPIAGSRRFRDMFPELVTLRELPGCDHAMEFNTDPRWFGDQITRWESQLGSIEA